MLAWATAAAAASAFGCGPTARVDGDGSRGDDPDGVAPDAPPDPDGDGDRRNDECPELGTDSRRIPASLWVDSMGPVVSRVDAGSGVEVARHLLDWPTGVSDFAINRRGDALVVGEGYSLVRGAGCDSGPAGPGAPGTDECVAWFHALESGLLYAPAWRDVCGRDDLRAWVALTSESGGEVWLLDTADGSVVEVVDIPGELRPWVRGAADAGGNYWILAPDSDLHRIDAADHTVRSFAVPDRIGEDFVGNSFDSLTIDRDGYLYVCSHVVMRFDPSTETWDAAWVEPRDDVGSFGRGCVADPDRDLLWVLAPRTIDEIAAVDRTTLQTVDWIKADGSYAVTVDDDGMLWVARSKELVRIDPATHQEIDRFGEDESGFEYLSTTANDFSGRTALAAGVR